jgi:hypothetical protein
MPPTSNVFHFMFVARRGDTAKIDRGYRCRDDEMKLSRSRFSR